MIDRDQFLRNCVKYAQTVDGEVEMGTCPVCEGPMPDQHFCCSMDCYKDAIQGFIEEEADGMIH